MANKHYRKWWVQMPIGFLFVSGGIASIVFSLDNRPNQEWPVWVIIAIITFNTGLALLGSSYVHKVKSDLIRRERKTRPGDREEF